jgi:aryl-alcohol dehydrogenase-like predicted oxidoreductase
MVLIKKIKNGEIVKIEKIIKKNKIRYFDTATVYRDSEKIIGNIRPSIYRYSRY